MAIEITLIIKTHEGDLLWNDFRTAIQESIRTMDSVGANLSTEGTVAGRWHIDELSMKSPTKVKLRYTADEDVEPPPDWMHIYVEGMKQLEEGEKQPVAFGEYALKHVSKLETLKNRIDSIQYITDGEGVVTSLKAASHATIVHEEVKRPAHYYSYGELRGELGQITMYESTSEFAIYDPITRRLIRCSFSPEDEEKIKKLLTKQVAVFGRITYDRHDRPTKVDVETFESLKDEDELATIQEIHKAMEPLPDGMSSEDYIRSQRDDD